MADPFHNQCRTEVAAMIVAGFAAQSPVIDLAVKTQDNFHPEMLDRPCLVVTFDAGAERVAGGTNASDYMAFPLAVLYLSVQGDLDPNDPPGGKPTLVRQVCRNLFNQKRIVALDTVYLCTYDPNGPIVDEGLVGQLQTQFTITVFARRPR